MTCIKKGRKLKGGDLSSPWNSGPEKEDVLSPWNDEVYRDDPRMPWNNNGGTYEDF